MVVVHILKGEHFMNCKVYDFKDKADKKENKMMKNTDKRKLMIRLVAIVCTLLIFGTFCISLFF